MDTTGTKWLSRKTWRRLVELHATGRITRRDLERLKGLLARPRQGVAATPPAAPALRLIRGGATPAPRPFTPDTLEVA